MTAADAPRPRKKHRAPDREGTALIDPPIEQHAALVEQNRALAEQWDTKSGVPFRTWRSHARCQLRAAAAGSTKVLMTESETPEQASRAIILSGHQPTLFHPGVWLKNFLLSSLAGRVGGDGINLVIDADVCKRASIDVPTRSANAYAIEDVPYDVVKEFRPWEECRISDPRLFDRFPDRVRETFASVVQVNSDLLLDRLWPFVIEASQQAKEKQRAVFRRAEIESEDIIHEMTEKGFNPSECFVAGRSRLESQIGLAKGEVAQSDPRFFFSFREFAALLLERHRELFTAYNEALLKFRLLSGSRNPSHPAPELQRNGDWYEVPFWLSAWRGRKRAFARAVGKTWQISDCEQVIVSPAIKDEDKLHIPWEPLPDIYGVKVRPRALITTMYARLVLSDLFIHGIGGAKYDEVTDEIIRRFFGIEPPKYVTATATFRLPIDRPHVTIDDARQAAEALRNVRFRPEMLIKHPMVTADPNLARELQALADEKRAYVHSHALRRASSDVYQRLDRINRAMHDRLRGLESHLRNEHARLIELARQSQLLGSREFSFVLFPEKFLVPQLLALSKVPA